MQFARRLPDWRGDCERHIKGSPGNQEAGNFLNDHKPQIHEGFVSQYQSRTSGWITFTRMEKSMRWSAGPGCVLLGNIESPTFWGQTSLNLAGRGVCVRR